MLSLKFSGTSTKNPTICSFSISSLNSSSKTTPWSLWSLSLSNGLMSFSSSVWMINRIHGRSKNCRTFSHPTTTTSFSNINLIPICIRNSTNSCWAFLMNKTYLTRWHLKLSIFTFLGKDESRSTSWANSSSSLSNNHLNIVNLDSSRNHTYLHTISWNWFCCIRNNHYISNFDCGMSKNISSFTISITNKSNKPCSIWIIFHWFHCSRNINFIEFEIDLTIEFLMSRTLMTHWNSTSTIASSMSLNRISECLMWSACSKLFISKTCHVTARRCIWFVLLDWHDSEFRI